MRKKQKQKRNWREEERQRHTCYLPASPRTLVFLPLKRAAISSMCRYTARAPAEQPDTTTSVAVVGIFYLSTGRFFFHKIGQYYAILLFKDGRQVRVPSSKP